MRSKIVLLILGLFYIGVQSELQIQIPGVSSISTIVNRLTNTTFGIVRGGLNIFTRTIDRIITSFGRVEDRIREILEEIRRQIIRGIPELSIPILDPLHIDKIDFNIVHDAVNIKGNVQDVTIQHISKFVTENERFRDLGNFRFQLDLNFTFPFIKINGLYDVDGIVGDTFKVFGNGKFWMNLIDFHLDISTIIRYEYPLQLRLSTLELNVKLGRLENYFDNLMGEKELEELFNKALSQMAPEALDMLWPDIKGPIEKEIKNYINGILKNATIANLVRRIFNIV